MGILYPLGVPMYDTAENDDFSFTVNNVSDWSDDVGTYNWSASGQAVRKLARWSGGDWIVHNDTSDPSYTHTTSDSGSWEVKETNVCSLCKQTGVSSPTAHYVTCPNMYCQEGGTYWNCYGVPSSHALLATCSSCNQASVYACSGHPDSCGSGSSPSDPVDNTPDCSYCTEGCSSCDEDDDEDDEDEDENDPPDEGDEDGCPEDYCWYPDDVTCIHCGVTYHICTSEWGDCSSSPDGWHSSE